MYFKIILLGAYKSERIKEIFKSSFNLQIHMSSIQFSPPRLNRLLQGFLNASERITGGTSPKVHQVLLGSQIPGAFMYLIPLGTRELGA